jgi:hypothetical protein
MKHAIDKTKVIKRYYICDPLLVLGHTHNVIKNFDLFCFRKILLIYNNVEKTPIFSR